MIDTTAYTWPFSRADRERAIESFMPAAEVVASRYGHWSLDRADLVQIAMLIVIAAIDSYDPACGFRLGQFVGQSLKWEMADAIKRLKRLSHFRGEMPKQVVDDSDPVELDDDDGRMVNQLWDAVEKLPARDRAILIGKFGLDGGPPKSREQLGRKHRRSTVTISKSTMRSLASLRRSLSGDGCRVTSGGQINSPTTHHPSRATA